MSIKNKITLAYEYDGEDEESIAECELETKDPVMPTIEITKVGSPNPVGIGDTILYNVTVVIGDGDDLYGDYTLSDVIDEDTEFVSSSLTVNGEVTEIQDLLDIEINLKPNTVYNITYQCIRIR